MLRTIPVRALGLAAAIWTQASVAADSSSTTPLSGGEIIATRGGVTLSVAELDAKVRTMPPEIRATHLSSAESLARTIDTVLLTKQLANEATRRGLDQKEEFDADLALLRTELLARLVQKDNLGSKTPPDFELAANDFYRANPDKFQTPKQVLVRHVLIDTKSRSDEEAGRIAREVLAKAKAGAKFEELVKQYSDDAGTRATGGMVEITDPEQFDRGFVLAVTKIEKVGELAGPAKTAFGYHVIKLDSIREPELRPFEQVRTEIVKNVEASWISSQRTQFLQSYSMQETDLRGEVVRALPNRYFTLHVNSKERSNWVEIDPELPGSD